MSKKQKTKTVKQKAPLIPKLQLDPQKKKVLHVGCGKPFSDRLDKSFKADEWQTIRLDSKREYQPDITSSLISFPLVKTESMNAVWSPYVLQRFSPVEVDKALREFYRVLIPGGFAMINVPDIQKIGEQIFKGLLPSRPIYSLGGRLYSALELLYGPASENGLPQENFKTTFSNVLLTSMLINAGFTHIRMKRDALDLWAVAYKNPAIPKDKAKVENLEPDINTVIKIRDELDKEPEIWKEITFKQA